jgi:hypothetical protein
MTAAAEEVTFDAPTPKKKTAKRKPARAAAPKKNTEQFPGLTRTACAATCNAQACTISGKPYCAHPNKGGLQFSDMQNRPAPARMEAARDFLARENLEAGLAKRRN